MREQYKEKGEQIENEQLWEAMREWCDHYLSVDIMDEGVPEIAHYSPPGEHGDEWHRGFFELPKGDVKQLLHEISHVLTAAPDELRLSNYGLQDGAIPNEKDTYEQRAYLMQYHLYAEAGWLQGLEGLDDNRFFPRRYMEDRTADPIEIEFAGKAELLALLQRSTIAYT